MRLRTHLFLLVCLLFMCTSASTSQTVKPVVPDIARPLPLSAVRLTGGPLKHAQDLDIEYLLKLEPDRMLAYYRKRAGLQPRAEGYGGWDGDGRNLTGHIAGHYLSAVSLMYAATGDVRFKQRADYIVKELKEVQDKNGDGFLSALDGVREKFAEVANGNIRSSSFDLNGLWSPWYTLHKTFAGLRDAYRYTGNKTALELETKYAAWAESILSKLDAEQTQKMLNTEFGGMNEVLVELYADTGNKRWLELSHHFDHHAVIDPLSRRDDKLAGLHGNTQVPKLLGVLMQYIYGGDKAEGVAAEFFWDSVVNNHTYATGGHGRDEYFGPPDKLAERVDGRTNESCNVYNMLKMTRRLFAINPDIKYAEFEEKALFNHVLASIDPEDGRTCYMVPVGQGVRHEYQDMQRSFTCCVGTGMESHGLHGDGIYYESSDKFWVNLFAPSTAIWKEAGAKFDMETDFPEGDAAKLTMTLQRPKTFTLMLRRPSWAQEGFQVVINGKRLTSVSKPGTFIEIKRSWKTGDTITLVLPKTLRLDGLPDNNNRAALMWGPLVLAGDLGPERRGPSEAITSFVAAQQDVSTWVKPIADKPGTFRTVGVGRTLDNAEHEIEFVPFYRLHRRMYALYWDLYTNDTWKTRLDGLARERAKQQQLEASTIAFVQPGDAQSEKSANQQGEDTSLDRMMGRSSRRGKKWFAYDLSFDSSQPVALVVTYNSEERGKRTFDVLVDDQKIGSQVIERSPPGSAVGSFFNVEYKVPAEMLKDKKKVTVKFQALGGNEIAAVYSVRLVKMQSQ
ncbi:MAG: hypothetical protein C5B55_01185 [Blastocatellia bacterium]|nr:MAG: hypothetical protein C5B55_01185 [Blastocatellia bacterium]